MIWIWIKLPISDWPINLPGMIFFSAFLDATSPSDSMKHLWKNRHELIIEDAGVAALFGLECYMWLWAGKIVGRGFTFTGDYPWKRGPVFSMEAMCHEFMLVMIGRFLKLLTIFFFHNAKVLSFGSQKRKVNFQIGRNKHVIHCARFWSGILLTWWTLSFNQCHCSLTAVSSLQSPCLVLGFSLMFGVRAWGWP